MFFGLTGFTARNGSKVSLSVQFAGGPGKPVSQVPTALGRESSISGPSVEAETPVGSASKPVSAIQAKPAPNFFSAARRVMGCARLFVSTPRKRGAGCPQGANKQLLSRASSNWLFIFFPSFLTRNYPFDLVHCPAAFLAIGVRLSCRHPV